MKKKKNKIQHKYLLNPVGNIFENDQMSIDSDTMILSTLKDNYQLHKHNKLNIWQATANGIKIIVNIKPSYMVLTTWF